MTVTGKIVDGTQKLIARGLIKWADRTAAKELGKEKIIIPDLRKRPNQPISNDAFVKRENVEYFDPFLTDEKKPDMLDKLEKIAPKTAGRIRQFLSGVFIHVVEILGKQK